MVRVNVSLVGDLLCVQVSDNGPGFPPGFSIGSGGHGLRNVADRIAGYYGNVAQLSWESGRNATQVFLKIPRSPVSELAKKNGGHAYSHRG
jgi:signal transduction histidine kinase